MAYRKKQTVKLKTWTDKPTAHERRNAPVLVALIGSDPARVAASGYGWAS